MVSHKSEAIKSVLLVCMGVALYRTSVERGKLVGGYFDVEGNKIEFEDHLHI